MPCIDGLSLTLSARSLPFGGVGGSGCRYTAFLRNDSLMIKGANTTAKMASRLSRTTNVSTVQYSHRLSHTATLSIPLLFEPLMSLRYPPLTNLSKTLLRLMLATPMPGRPKSVEDEERKLKWKKWRNLLLVLAVIAVSGVVSGTVVSRR